MTGYPDLVILDNETNENLAGIEIKLTALPDNTTCELPDNKFGCEIVVRPDTIVYLVLSIISNAGADVKEMIDEAFGESVLTLNWDDGDAVRGLLADMTDGIDKLVIKYVDNQKPLLLQPVWKTKGKSAVLADSCFDVFVWSDLAFTRLFVDQAKRELYRNRINVTR